MVLLRLKCVSPLSPLPPPSPCSCSHRSPSLALISIAWIHRQQQLTHLLTSLFTGGGRPKVTPPPSSDTKVGPDEEEEREDV